MTRRADAGLVQHILHHLLVPERDRLGDGHPGQIQHLAHAGGEDHERLPETLDPVERRGAGVRANLLDDRFLVRERADLDVVRQTLPCDLGHRLERLVSQPDDPGADLRQTAREVLDLRRVARRYHEDVHRFTSSVRVCVPAGPRREG